MGYDLLVRGNSQYTEYREREEVVGFLSELGLTPGSRGQWTRKQGNLWLELYVSEVSSGPDGGDFVEGDGKCFNQISLHPKPLHESAFRIAHAVAAFLGWQIYDPQQGEKLRDVISPDARQTVQTPQNSDSILRSEALSISKNNWREHGTALCAIDESRFLLAYGGQYVSSPHGISERDNKDSEAAHFSGRAPLSLSPDQARWACGYGSRDEHGQLLLHTWATEKEQLLPLVACSAWHPHNPKLLLCLTRRSEHLAEGSVELPDLPSSEAMRMLLLNCDTLETYPFSPDELVGHSFGGSEKLAISGDGETAFMASHYGLHAFSLENGELLWRRRLPSEGSAIYALATSPCGNWVAIGGLCPGRGQANLLRIYSAQNGKLALAHSGKSLTTTSSINALAFHTSGRLFAGLGSGILLEVVLDGSWYKHNGLSGAIRAIALSPSEKHLWIAGTAQEVREVKLDKSAHKAPTDERERADFGAALAKRAAQWQHGKKPDIHSQHPEDILAHPPPIAGPRLAKVPDAVAVLQKWLPIVSQDEVQQRRAFGLCLAAATFYSDRGEHIPEEYYPLISSLATQTAVGWHIEVMQKISQTINRAHRCPVLLADRSTASWQRFYLAGDEGLVIAMEMLESWPKAIYTQLKKQKPKLSYANGYSSKEFWQHAHDLLLFYGKQAKPLLEDAIEAKSVHKSLYKKVLKAMK